MISERLAAWATLTWYVAAVVIQALGWLRWLRDQPGWGARILVAQAMAGAGGAMAGRWGFTLLCVAGGLSALVLESMSGVPKR
jgi:hypothetical protein